METTQQKREHLKYFAEMPQTFCGNASISSFLNHGNSWNILLCGKHLLKNGNTSTKKSFEKFGNTS